MVGWPAPSLTQQTYLLQVHRADRHGSRLVFREEFAPLGFLPDGSPALTAFESVSMDRLLRLKMQYRFLMKDGRLADVHARSQGA